VNAFDANKSTLLIADLDIQLYWGVYPFCSFRWQWTGEYFPCGNFKRWERG